MTRKKAVKKFTKNFEKILYEKIGGEDADEYRNYIHRKIGSMTANDFALYVMLGIFTSECLEPSWLEEFMGIYNETSNV